MDKFFSYNTHYPRINRGNTLVIQIENENGYFDLSLAFKYMLNHFFQLIPYKYILNTKSADCHL